MDDREQHRLNDTEPTLERTKLALENAGAGPRQYLTVIIVLVALAYLSGGIRSALVLILVLFSRDVFRLTVMRALDAVDARLLLLPLAKGVVPVGLAPGREAAVILSGPLFLMVLSVGAFVVDRTTGMVFAHDIALCSVGLAGFFLLPLKPYDGWRLLNLCLFSRWATLEAVVAAVTSVALAALGVVLQAWALTVIALLQLFGIPFTLKLRKAADDFKARIGSVPAVDTAKLDDVPLRALHEATLQQMQASYGQQAQRDPDGTARSLAVFMREVHARAGRAPVSGAMTAVLLLVYGALVTYFVVGLFVVLALAKQAQ